MGEDFASAIAAEAGPDDVVAICPDQLGPATLRSLPETVDAVGLPALDRPDRIDWRDYADRNEAADPAVAVEALLERAEGGSVWLVINTHYRTRSEEHTSELQSLMRISYAVFCLKKKKK